MNAPGIAALRRLSTASLRWPLPALMCWGICWMLFVALEAMALPMPVPVPIPIPIPLMIATAFGGAMAVFSATPWRRVITAAGFPLSLVVSRAASGMVFGGAASLPAWAWLLPLGLLALVYPVSAWRDAPIFPTPSGALAGLGRLVPLKRRAAILDAGCGLGAALIELRREYPQARLCGYEWSWPLRWICAARCRFATVSRRDLWSADWSGFDLVYLFQRPESMQRAADKAAVELGHGRWLVSLEFEVKSLLAQRVLDRAGARRVWLYQAPFVRAAGPPAP